MSNWTLYEGDCLEVMRQMPDNSFDAVVTDPPYGLSREPDIEEVLRQWLAGGDYQHRGGGFMGKTWDSFVPGPRGVEGGVPSRKAGRSHFVLCGHKDR